MSNLVKLGSNADGDVTVDIEELLESRMIIQGNSRSGKSYLARVLCERAAKHVPVIILDIEGEFASIRQEIDALLIAPNGDIPVDLRSAALLAQKLAELRISAIIDIYELKAHERLEYARRFLDALVNIDRKYWGPMMIVIDEAHKLCPEKGQGEAVSTQSVIDLMSLGGKRQFCGVLITQRFSKLHNSAMAEGNNVFIGRTWMDADQKRSANYLGMSPTEQRTLRDIPQGEFYAFGPAVSPIGVVRFKGDRAATSAPKPGDRKTFVPPKPSDAIREIIGQIDDLPEVAMTEARNLDEAKAQFATQERGYLTEIAELRRQLENAPAPVVQEKLVFPEESIIALQDKVDSYFATISELARNAVDQAEAIENGIYQIRSAIPTEEREVERPQPAPAPVTPSPVVVERKPVATATGELSPLQMSMLGAIALYHKLGLANPTIAQIGAVIGKHHNSGPIRGAFNKLHEAGFATISGANIRLEPAGHAFAVVPNIRSQQDIHQLWLERVKGNEQSFLRALIEVYPRSISLSDLGDRIQKNINSGPIRGALNSLVDKGLAEFPDPQSAIASDVLFPVGLSTV